MLISTTMAIESLKEQVRRVDDSLDTYKREIAIRDDLIRDMHANKVHYKMLVQITGLSRDRLYTIVNNPSKSVGE